LTEVIEAPPVALESVPEPAPEPVAVPVTAVPAAPTATPAPDLSQLPIPRSLLIDPAPPLPTPPAAPAASGVVVDEAAITQRVLTDLQRQIDGMLEYRLREALAPILARATDALMRDLRQELSKTMNDVVARAVAQEVARQRSRN
jgi:hypothetical protein